MERYDRGIQRTRERLAIVARILRKRDELERADALDDARDDLASATAAIRRAYE